MPERIVQLAGQPAFAWAPGQLWLQEGPRWEHCYRAALERTVERAAGLGYEFKAGLELEWFIGEDSDEPTAAHHGPVYSPNAMLDVSEFVSELLGDLDANGLEIGQIHAEYGWSQMEISLDATDPLTAADNQLLARETIRDASRSNGLRSSFAPLITPDGVGNGWHFHVSILKDGVNLLSGGDGPEGMTPEGEAFVAGILRDLPGVVAVTAPSVPSLIRLRPGLLRERVCLLGRRQPRGLAALRARSRGHRGAEREHRAQGLGRLRQPLPRPHGDDRVRPRRHRGRPDAARVDQRGPGRLDARAAPGGRRAPLRPDRRGADRELRERAAHPRGVRRPLANAFVGVRRSDEAWADGKSADEIVGVHLWRY